MRVTWGQGLHNVTMSASLKTPSAYTLFKAQSSLSCLLFSKSNLTQPFHDDGIQLYRGILFFGKNLWFILGLFYQLIQTDSDSRTRVMGTRLSLELEQRHYISELERVKVVRMMNGAPPQLHPRWYKLGGGQPKTREGDRESLSNCVCRWKTLGDQRLPHHSLSQVRLSEL